MQSFRRLLQNKNDNNGSTILSLSEALKCIKSRVTGNSLLFVNRYKITKNWNPVMVLDYSLLWAHYESDTTLKYFPVKLRTLYLLIWQKRILHYSKYIRVYLIC